MAGQDPKWGVVLNVDRPVPIYHLFGLFESGRAITRCGRVVSWGGMSPYLPIKHLKRFARVCRSCSQA